MFLESKRLKNMFLLPLGLPGGDQVDGLPSDGEVVMTAYAHTLQKVMTRRTASCAGRRGLLLKCLLWPKFVAHLFMT